MEVYNGMRRNNVERPGTCHVCGEGVFKLLFINRILVRKCKECNALFDTEKLAPYIGEQDVRQ